MSPDAPERPQVVKWTTRADLGILDERRETDPRTSRPPLHPRPVASAVSSKGLSDAVKAELKARFRAGERPTAGEYLARFPALRDHAVSLAFEEYLLLEESREPVEVAAFCDRYPDWRDSLHKQLECYRLLSRRIVRSRRPAFPEVGTWFAGRFLLLEVLGGGGAGQVYLVDEPAFPRRAVLKLSPWTSAPDRESATQGRLDHPRIVPIFSVLDDPESGLRGTCMPYRPGRSLDHLFPDLVEARASRKAIEVLRAFAPRWEPTSPRPPKGWEGFPIRGTSDDAFAWIGLELAEALAHSHDAGVIHCDVKPANLYIAEAGGPQLLDFNLARDFERVDRIQDAHSGGTLPYMAPEQIEAFLEPALWPHVGPKVDIYALGLVLLELFTGSRPEAPSSSIDLGRAIREMLDRRSLPTPSARDYDQAVAPEIDAILRKCIEADPSDRYRSAEALAEAFGGFLDRRSSGSLGGSWTPRHTRIAPWKRVGIFAPLLALGLLPILARGLANDRSAREFEESLVLGKSAFRASNWATALRHFDEVLVVEPHEPQALQGKALTFWYSRPRQVDSTGLLAEILGNLAEAERYFRIEVAEDPGARNQLALLFVDRAKILIDASVHGPKTLDPSSRMGLLERAESESRHALRLLEELEADHQGQMDETTAGWALYSRGRSHHEMSIILAQGRNSQFRSHNRRACALYHEALEYFPDNPSILGSLAAALTQRIEITGSKPNDLLSLRAVLERLEAPKIKKTPHLLAKIREARAALNLRGARSVRAPEAHQLSIAPVGSVMASGDESG